MLQVNHFTPGLRPGGGHRIAADEASEHLNRFIADFARTNDYNGIRKAADSLALKYSCKKHVESFSKGNLIFISCLAATVHSDVVGGTRLYLFTFDNLFHNATTILIKTLI